MYVKYNNGDGELKNLYHGETKSPLSKRHLGSSRCSSMAMMHSTDKRKPDPSCTTSFSVALLSLLQIAGRLEGSQWK